MKKQIKRSTAIASGAMRYYTGKPCKHGHKAERWTLNGMCVECQAERRKKEVALIHQIRADYQV
jgi:hypothetical protein